MLKYRGFTKKDQELWEFLNQYITDNEGWLVSRPELHTLTFQCRLDSTLPELLRSAGYDVVNAGTAERLLPSVIDERRGGNTIATQSVSPCEVAVYSFDLPLIETNKAAP
jgi:hypothetical protein